MEETLERIASALERIAEVAPDVVRIGAVLDQMCYQDTSTGAGYLRTASPDEIDVIAASSANDSTLRTNSERAADALEDLTDIFANCAESADKVEEHLSKFAETIDRKHVQIRRSSY